MFLIMQLFLIHNSFSEELVIKKSWESYPDIIICKDSTNISKERVKNSFDFWINKYNVNFHYKNIIESIDCSNKKYDNIYVTGEWNIKDDILANTKTSSFHYSDNPNKHYIDRAIIQIPEIYSDNETILLHEVGHAIGLDHSKNTIMNEYYSF